MSQTRRYTGLFPVAIFLVACGGGGGSDSGAPPVTQPPSVENTAALEARLGDLNVTDYAVVIGDEYGVLLSREFGDFSVTESYLIASATKWLAAMVIMDLV